MKPQQHVPRSMRRIIKKQNLHSQPAVTLYNDRSTESLRYAS